MKSKLTLVLFLFVCSFKLHANELVDAIQTKDPEQLKFKALLASRKHSAAELNNAAQMAGQMGEFDAFLALQATENGAELQYAALLREAAVHARYDFIRRLVLDRTASDRIRSGDATAALDALNVQITVVSRERRRLTRTSPRTRRARLDGLCSEHMNITELLMKLMVALERVEKNKAKRESLVQAHAGQLTSMLLSAVREGDSYNVSRLANILSRYHFYQQSSLPAFAFTHYDTLQRALLLAAERGFGTLIEPLLESAEDARLTLDLDAVLRVAARHAMPRFVEALLLRRANPNVPDPNTGYTALHEFLRHNRNRSPNTEATFALLLPRGDFSIATPGGTSALELLRSHSFHTLWARYTAERTVRIRLTPSPIPPRVNSTGEATVRLPSLSGSSSTPALRWVGSGGSGRR